MPAAVPSMSIAPMIVTSTTGTTIQALDNLTGETSGIATATMMTTTYDQKTGTTEGDETDKKKRHWWSRICMHRGRPCRQMPPLESARAPRRSSSSSSRGPQPLNEDMFPRRIRTNSSQSLPTMHSSGSSNSNSNSNSSASDTSRTTIEGAVRSSTSSDSHTGVAGLYEALGTRAIMKEQKKLQNYRARQGILDDRALDTLVFGGAFVIL